MHPRPRLTAVIRMRSYGSMPTLRASSVLPQNCWSASFPSAPWYQYITFVCPVVDLFFHNSTSSSAKKSMHLP